VTRVGKDVIDVEGRAETVKIGCRVGLFVGILLLVGVIVGDRGDNDVGFELFVGKRDTNRDGLFVGETVFGAKVGFIEPFTTVGDIDFVGKMVLIPSVVGPALEGCLDEGFRVASDEVPGR